MTLTQVRSIEVLPWNAFPESAFPDGSWLCHLLVAHDASGGEIIMQVDVQTASAPLSARIFSVEAFNYTELTQAAGGGRGLVETRNMLRFQRLQVADFGWSFLAVNNRDGRGIEGRDLAILPWFIGQPRGAGVAAGFDLRVDNGGVGQRSDLVVMGYFWEPEAANAPGGPQRPTTGLFG